MIEGLINKLKKYYSPSKVIATGGLSLIFKNNIKLYSNYVVIKNY